jgi:phage regulator Rha-like protein
MRTTFIILTTNFSKYLLFFLLSYFPVFSQPIEKKTENYYNGQNGIELIANSNNGTVIVSTFDSKIELKEEIAETIYKMYNEKKIKNDTIISIPTETAIVTGNFRIKNKAKLTDLSFYFHKIEWINGLTEIHQGEQFISKPSSIPFSGLAKKKKKVSKTKPIRKGSSLVLK